MPNPVCPYCGEAKWEDGPRFFGHKSICKQKHQGKEAPKASAKEEPKPQTTDSTPPTPSTGTPTKLEPVTFAFGENEKLPEGGQEIPDFKSPEEQAKEEKKGEPTPKATLAEERKAGVSAIAALLLPLADMWNRTIEGGEAWPSDPKTMKLTSADMENLAQAIILVDEKHGGPLSKTLGGDFGPEIFLIGVSLGLGIKMYLGLRMRKPKTRQSAAPSSEEIPREKPILEKMGDTLKSALGGGKKEEKKPEEAKPEGVLSEDEFMKEAQRRVDMGAGTG